MTTVTRYKAAKLTGITEAVFSRMWHRQNDGEDYYEFFTDDGKIDIDDPSFISRYNDRIKPDVMEKIKNPVKPKPKPEPERKKVPVKKVVPKKSAPKKKAEKKTVKIKPEPKPTPKKETPETEPEKPLSATDEKLKELQKKSAIAKHEKVIIDKEKSQMELKKARAELAEVETLGKTLIGYCIALNQTLLDQPRSFIDEFEMAVKKGKSKTDLTDIIRIPASSAIEDTIKIIKKELDKYRRAVRRANKKHEQES